MTTIKDVNFQLRKAYVGLLKEKIIIDGKSIPIYYGYVGESNLDYYILIQNINSNDNSPKCTVDTKTTIQLTIFSRKENNSGKEVDEIAGKIFELADLGIALDENFQVIYSRCIIDKCMNYADTSIQNLGTFKIFERHLIFEHDIYHKWRKK